MCNDALFLSLKIVSFKHPLHPSPTPQEHKVQGKTINYAEVGDRGPSYIILI